MSELKDAPYPEKLRFLADLFDKHDRRAFAEKMGVTEAEVPDYMLSGSSEVQNDLRHVADELERLLKQEAEVRRGETTQINLQAARADALQEAADLALRERDRLRAAVDAALALHPRYVEEDSVRVVCTDCLEAWPCATVRALSTEEIP